MVWQEIYFSKILKKNELKEVVAEAFNIDKNYVVVISDMSILDNYSIEYKILCRTYLLNKNEIFKLRVNISCIDELEPKNDIEIFAKLIELLNCKILIDNYSIIPNTMLVIESITINDDDFEEAQEFNLEE